MGHLTLDALPAAHLRIGAYWLVRRSAAVELYCDNGPFLTQAAKTERRREPLTGGQCLAPGWPRRTSQGF